jgi:nucleoside-diphosphate-sugar epimerase
MSFYRDKKILVTGGASFIGSHLDYRSAAWVRDAHMSSRLAWQLRGLRN